MKTLRIIVIILLTAAVLLVITSPALLSGILPENILTTAKLEEFPLLGSCVEIASQLIASLKAEALPPIAVVTNAIGPTFWDELSSLLMVAVLSIPVSLLLGFLLYKPLYRGPIWKTLLYISLNLVSVMAAWIIYRRFYFTFVIEGLLMENITNTATLTVVNFLTQLISAAAIGTLALKVALAALATRIVVGKIIMPIIGTLIRTLLFAFFIALILLLQSDPTTYMLTLPVMLAALGLSAVTDWIFGS
ncbi:MAG: hypothetical protein IKW00_06950 [Clostridia bacterium]|nr:hypothetical protein [Clostridia bacterium]